MREIRHDAGFTLTAAAEAAGLQPGRLSALELGSALPTTDDLLELQSLYGVHLRITFAIVEDEA